MTAVDKFGKLALHYAVKSGSLELVTKILSDPDYKVDANHKDQDHNSALSICCKGLLMSTYLYPNSTYQ